MADFNIEIGFDDSEIFKGLKRTSGELNDIEKEAKQLDNTLDKSFKDLNKSVKTLNKNLDNTGKSIDKAAKNQKKLSSSVRGIQRDLSVVKFAAFGAFSGIVDGVVAAVEGFQKFSAVVSPAIAQQQQLNAATAASASELVKEKINLESKLQAASENNENTKERIAARNDLIAQYPTIFQGNSDEAFSEEALAQARKLGTAAIIENIVQKQKQVELQRIVTELAAAEASTIQGQVEANTAVGQAADIATGAIGQFFAFSTAGLVNFNTEYSNVAEQINETGKSTLIEQAKNIGQFEEGLRKNLGQISDALDETDVIDAAAQSTGENIAKNVAKGIAKAAPIVADSLAGLQKQLQAINKEINETVSAGDAQALIPLINDAKELEAAISMAKDTIKELRGELDETEGEREARLKKQAEIFIQLTLDEETRLRAQVLMRQKARDEEIKEIIQDGVLQAKALGQSKEQTEKELTDIDKKFAEQRKAEADKEAADTLSDAQEADNQEIARTEAFLRQKQALEVAALDAVNASEEDRTALQEQQEAERQRLTLESEKKRLETVLKFSQGRTQAEIAATQAMLAAVNQELANFDVQRSAAIEEGGKGFNLLQSLGFDEKEQDAIKQGVGQAVGGLENLFAAQVDLANQAVEVKNAQIQELRGQLQTELQLNEQGFASNVEGKQRELEEQEKLREIALEKQKKAQQAQLALQTIMQTVNLITASTQIFNALAGAGPIGVGIAVATIAAMFGAFIASKAKAASLTKLADGGQLEGPSHADGGIPIGIGGRAPTYEAEGGEWVVKKTHSKEHNSFLKRLNKGDFKGMNLDRMVKGAERMRTLGVVVEKVSQVQDRKSQQLTMLAFATAIQGQTGDLLSKGFDKLYSKPEINIVDKNTIVEVKQTKNGRIIKQINLKQ